MDTLDITLSQDAGKKVVAGTITSDSSKESQPNSWRLVKLRDICKKTDLVNPFASPEKPFDYIDVSSVSNESYRIVEARRILGKDAPSRARKSVQTDDIIFATVRPTLKRVALIPSELDGQVCSTGFCVLRANRKYLEPQYLYFLLLTEAVSQRVEALQKGATYPAINDSDLFNLLIPLPPIPEQDAIAHSLQTVQEAIQARRDELDLERERKVALMEYLFTNGTRGEITKQTEIGEVPESWKIVRLRDVIQDAPQNGAFVKQPQLGRGTPYVNVYDIYQNTTINLNRVERMVCEPSFVERYVLKESDILFVRSSLKREGIGQCCLVSKLEEPAIFDCHLIKVSPNTTVVEPLYLTYFFLSEYGRNELIARSKTTTMTTINQNTLIDSLVPIPSIAEQGDITKALEASENKIAVAQQEVSLLEELLHSILEELMTGRLSTLPLIAEGGKG